MSDSTPIPDGNIAGSRGSSYNRRRGASDERRSRDRGDRN